MWTEIQAEGDDYHLICRQHLHTQVQAHPQSPPLTNLV